MRIVAALATLLLVACASGPGNPRDRYDRLLTPRANPGKVVATELAFARAAQEDGQWTAFADYSTDDAVMFVPEPVNAHTWLKGRANPARAVQWQPHEVWSSCDGSLAVTKGAWQRPDGIVGYFTTVWERQKDGEYEWVLDQGDALDQPLAAPDFVKTTVSDCNGDVTATGQGPAGSARTGQGASKDRSLTYSWSVDENLARTLSVSIFKDGEMIEALHSEVAAPAQ